MPTYDYKCLDCGITFEEFQKMTDEHLTVCPECGGHLKRLIGAGSGPIFKGKGFYQTDYKNNTSSSKPETKTSVTKPKETKSSAGKESSSTASAPKDK